jgi:transmembrane sensor
MTRCLTDYGEVKNFTMPDGSAITLNANSSLSFPTVWDEQEEREVQLTGEAFFEVAKKTGKSNAKFVVHTKGIDIEVLGTQFNVNNRRDKVQVVLQEGKVSLSPAGKEHSQTLMTPGDLVEYSQKDNKMEHRKVNPFMYSSWKEEETLFEDKPLLEIAQQLEDTRGMQVIFAEDSLRQLRFTGSLPNNDLDKFLLILSKSFGITVSRKGSQIILQKNTILHRK